MLDYPAFPFSEKEVPYSFSKLRMRRFENVTIRRENFVNQDISDADALYNWITGSPAKSKNAPSDDPFWVTA